MTFVFLFVGVAALIALAYSRGFADGEKKQKKQRSLSVFILSFLTPEERKSLKNRMDEERKRLLGSSE